MVLPRFISQLDNNPKHTFNHVQERFRPDDVSRKVACAVPGLETDRKLMERKRTANKNRNISQQASIDG